MFKIVNYFGLSCQLSILCLRLDLFSALFCYVTMSHIRTSPIIMFFLLVDRTKEFKHLKKKKKTLSTSNSQVGLSLESPLLKNGNSAQSVIHWRMEALY